jgi:thiamine biosynthesis protein ThiI
MKEYLLLDLYNLVLIRYNEIWLKSTKVKIRMLKTLMNNIKNILNRKDVSFHKYQISKDSTRLFFFFNNEDIPRAMELINFAFGTHSFSPTIRTSNKIKNISERAIEIADRIIHEGDTFALRVKRSGNQEYSSKDVATKVGQAIVDHFKKSNVDLRVNLSNPDKRIFIEVRDQFSYIFTDIIYSDWGGLPIESNKKIACMDVGRLNDLLAAFMIMRRGSEIYPILFDLTENDDLFNTRISNWKQNVDFAPFYKFTVRRIKFRKIMDRISELLKENQYTCAMCRLLRYDVLGKILGEGVDRSIDRIRAISDGVSLNDLSLCPDEVELKTISLNYMFVNQPNFTPLIGLDSDKINEFLKTISTNFKKVDYCPFKPKNQEFNAEDVKKIYNSLNPKKLISECIHDMEKIKII